MWTRRAKTYRTSPLRASLLAELNTTQGKVAGFDLGALQAAHVVLIGVGGIGSQVASALIRKGVGRLTLIDDDVVELKNLTRQHFGRRDVGKYKAHRLAKAVVDTGLFPTEVTAQPFRFQELSDRAKAFDDTTILICGVDNNATRRAVCEFAHERRLPAIYAAVSRTGNEAYMMVEEPDRACWACAFPQYVNDQTYPCNLPGIADVLMVVAGQIVFTVDTLLSGRPREWNVRETFLDGSLPDRARTVERRADCPICGNAVHVSET